MKENVTGCFFSEHSVLYREPFTILLQNNLNLSFDFDLVVNIFIANISYNRKKLVYHTVNGTRALFHSHTLKIA